jgi:hypothetical protein
MTRIERNQTYRCVVPGRSTRIRILGVTPWGAGCYGRGTATVVTVHDDGCETGLRTVSLDKLHTDPLTRDGQPRRSGYVLASEPS